MYFKNTATDFLVKKTSEVWNLIWQTWRIAGSEQTRRP